MTEDFSKEIFIVNPKTYKTTILQYSNEKLFEKMLIKCRELEKQEEIKILDVRNSIYTI